MTNSDFLSEALGQLSSGQYGWICSFASPPDQGEWGGRFYTGTERQAAVIDMATATNNYFCTAVLAGTNDAGNMARTKHTFQRLACLVVDDVDPDSLLGGFSWSIQTSPGKFQVGILLDQHDPDCNDLALVDAVMSALSARGKLGGNDTSGNAAVRYVRLPFGVNTKPRPAGTWQVKLESWNPSVRWGLDDACEAVGVDLDTLREAIRSGKTTKPTSSGSSSGEPMGSVAGEALSMLSAPLDQRSYHDALIRMAASLVAGGMYPGAAVEFLYSLMDQVRPTGPAEEVARWQARRAEIPRAVKTAEKYAPEDRAPAQVNITLNAQPLPEAPEDMLLSLKELERRSQSVKWQVKGLVPDDSLGMMFGASGTFKSFIALDHALHVAHGLQWMGKKTRQGGVVYVAAEGGAGIFRRVQAWHQEYGLVLADNFHVCVAPVVLSFAEHVDQLAAAIAAVKERPGLIYIDTLSQTFSGDENSATDISTYLRLINAGIRAKFNCTVIVIHHSGHQATERPRGSSAITANVDFLLGVYRPDAGMQVARLEVVKQKDGDKLAAQTFELQKQALGSDADGDEISSLVANWKDYAQPVLDAFRARLAGHEQLLMELLSAAGGQALDIDLRHQFYNRLGQEAVAAGKEYKQDTGKKAYLRAYKALRDKGLVAINSAGLVTTQTAQAPDDVA